MHGQTSGGRRVVIRRPSACTVFRLKHGTQSTLAGMRALLASGMKTMASHVSMALEFRALRVVGLASPRAAGLRSETLFG